LAALDRPPTLGQIRLDPLAAQLQRNDPPAIAARNRILQRRREPGPASLERGDLAGPCRCGRAGARAPHRRADIDRLHPPDLLDQHPARLLTPLRPLLAEPAERWTTAATS
jgi:hypothetical protein